MTDIDVTREAKTETAVWLGWHRRQPGSKGWKGCQVWLAQKMAGTSLMREARAGRAVRHRCQARRKDWERCQAWLAQKMAGTSLMREAKAGRAIRLGRHMREAGSQGGKGSQAWLTQASSKKQRLSPVGFGRRGRPARPGRAVRPVRLCLKPK